MNGWKTVVAKFKVKDNGLQKALAAYEGLDEDKFDERLKALVVVGQLADKLQKVKEVAAIRDVDKYLDGVLACVKAAPGEIKNAKALAEKKAAEAKKQEQKAQQAAGQEEEEEEDETGDSITKLKKALQALKLSKKPYFFLVCDAKPYGLVVSKKDIRMNLQAKKELAELAGGSTRPPKSGECRFENGKHVFEMEKPPSGLARILQKWIKDSIGVGLKVMVGTESGDEDGDGQPDAEQSKDKAAGPGAPESGQAEPPLAAPAITSIGSSVGRGGKNKPEDVQAVQTSLNRRIEAGLPIDGKCSPATLKAIEEFQKALGQLKPDGLIEPGRGPARALAGTGKLPPPPPPPQPIPPPKLGKASLAKAPAVWHNMRNIVDTNVELVKKVVKDHYSNEHPNLIKEIDDGLVKLDVITGKLDHRIADSLAKANAAANDSARKAELKVAKGILAEYLQFVKSEPLIAHLDDNPWLKIELKKTLTDHLTHMTQSMG